MKTILGELIGTFILVFLGCGSVGYSIFIQPLDLLVIAFVWCIAVILGIVASSPFSQSHLNPAVTFGFAMNKDLKAKEIPAYLIGQIIGAFVAALMLYLLFQDVLQSQMVSHQMMFGEYYPNPGNPDLSELDMSFAFLAEFTGTFLLMFGIFQIIRIDHRHQSWIHPVLIGIVLMTLIYFIAPFTQAGFNPARDFAPRLFSYFNGWELAFSYNGWGWLIVYIIAPIMGAIFGALIYRWMRMSKSS